MHVLCWRTREGCTGCEKPIDCLSSPLPLAQVTQQLPQYAVDTCHVDLHDATFGEGLHEAARGARALGEHERAAHAEVEAMSRPE